PSDAGGADASLDAPFGPDAETDGGAIDCGMPTCIWCNTVSPKPLFCTDFDENPFDYDWMNTIVPAPGRLGADSTVYRSPRYSLFSLVQGSSMSGNTYAYLTKTFTGLTAATDFTFAFDLLLQQMVSGPHALVAELNVGDSNHSLDLAVAAGDTTLQEV